MSLLKKVEDTFSGKMGSLLIGDPYYFEELSNDDSTPELKQRLLNFVVIEHFDCPVVATIETFEDKENDSILTTVHIREEKAKQQLKFLPAEESIMTVTNKKLVGEMKEQELGCDTACFEVNGNKISTGADGQYGTLYSHPENHEIYVFLSVSDDMYDVESFHREIAYGVKSQIS